MSSQSENEITLKGNQTVVCGGNRESYEEIKNEINSSGSNEDWQKREKELQEKIAEYESALEKQKSQVSSLQTDLKKCTQEKDDLKKQVTKLEKQLTTETLKGGQNHDANSKDMVTNARSVIFEKTKTCKNQELQIEALTQQVTSLKEIVAISKDMLDIRNMEVKQLQDKMDCMELRFTAEKDRHALIHAKLEKMIRLNADLKTEYEKQLKLFTQLQKEYRKHQALKSEENGVNATDADDKK